MSPDYENMVFTASERQQWEEQLGDLSQYIERWRRPAHGVLTVEETAAAARVHLELTEHPEEDRSIGSISELKFTQALKGGINLLRLKRYTPDKLFVKVQVNPYLSEEESARVMAHELGHLVWFDKLGKLRSGGYLLADGVYEQERFAEYFARQMVISGHGSLPYHMPSGPEITGQLELFEPDVYKRPWPKIDLDWAYLSGEDWCDYE